MAELEAQLNDFDLEQAKEAARASRAEYEGLRELYTRKNKEFDDSIEEQEQSFARESALKRHNLDLLNGAWLVKEIDSENVSEHNMRVVVDAVMQTIHGDTGCNIINGIITLDPSKDMAIQFEDLHSTEHDCEAIDFETALLLALESTESCKRINQNEMALLDNKGNIVLVLQRINLR